MKWNKIIDSRCGVGWRGVGGIEMWVTGVDVRARNSRRIINSGFGVDRCGRVWGGGGCV